MFREILAILLLGSNRRTQWSEKHENFCINLTAHGYGDDYDSMKYRLELLTEEDIDALSYNCYRTAEKLGKDSLSCEEVSEFAKGYL